MSEPTSNLTLMPGGNGNVSVTQVNAEAEKAKRKQRPTISSPVSPMFAECWNDFVARQNVGKSQGEMKTSADILRMTLGPIIGYDEAKDPEQVQARRKFENKEARKAALLAEREQKKAMNKAIDNMKAEMETPGVDKMAALLKLAKQLGIDVDAL